MRKYIDHYRWGMNYYRLYRLFRWQFLTTAIALTLLAVL